MTVNKTSSIDNCYVSDSMEFLQTTFAVLTNTQDDAVFAQQLGRTSVHCIMHELKMTIVYNGCI